MFFDICDEQKIDRRRFAGLKMAVVGGATAKWLRHYGYDADLVPEDYTVESLSGALADAAGDSKVLAIRAVKGNEILYKVFDERGTRYDKILLYDSEGELAVDNSLMPSLDWLLFGSGSGVDLFFETAEKAGVTVPDSVKFACIGDPTASELAKYGYDAAISASRHTADELAKLLAERIREDD